jgi:hypothetical protein
MNRFSFKDAYESLPSKYKIEVRERIKNALTIKNNSFYARMRGDVDPRLSEVDTITSIFREYGICDAVFIKDKKEN